MFDLDPTLAKHLHDLRLPLQSLLKDPVQSIVKEAGVFLDDALLLQNDHILLGKLDCFLRVALLEREVLLDHKDLLLLEDAHSHLRLLLEEIKLRLARILPQRDHFDLMLLLDLYDLIAHVFLHLDHFLLFNAGVSIFLSIVFSLVLSSLIGPVPLFVVFFSGFQCLPEVVLRSYGSVKFRILAISSKVVCFVFETASFVIRLNRSLLFLHRRILKRPSLDEG